MLERKRWRELVAKEEWFHLARFRFGRDRISAHHTHDFPEIFWVEHGTATHHINGSTKRLDAGDIVFVRPRDQHHLSAVDAEGFVLVNLAFARSVLMDFRRRHVAATRRFHNETAVLPARVQLSRAQLSELTEELARLGSHLDQFRALLRDGGAVGRQFDFLAQELHREVNTIASKADDAELVARVLEARTLVERIREQVQNVE